MPLILIAAFIFWVQGASADYALVATTAQSLNVRAGPGQTYALLSTLPVNTAVTLEERSPLGTWLRIRSNTVDGWVTTSFLKKPGDFNLNDLPINTTLADADVSRIAAKDEAALASVPIIPAMDSHVRDIFQKGQELGNHPNVIAKVGDCNSESDSFLTALDAGSYDLGAYQYLQGAVDFFGGSFGTHSVAANTGFTAMAALDPLWANPKVCQPGESPLLCEYNLHHPSVAIIMFGTNDLYVLNSEQYQQALTQIVEISLDHGVIPALSTFTSNRDKTDRWDTVIRFNQIVVDVAKKYDVPVMNFWLAAQALPNYGMGDDNAHLTASGVRVAFTGEENWSGFALRNLIALQTLDDIRRAVAG
jgi:hypothetical protein